MLSVLHYRSDLPNARKTLCNKIEQCGIVRAKPASPTRSRADARDRHEHSILTGTHTPRVKGCRSRSADDATEETVSAPFTRSSTRLLDKDLCFFCQERGNERLLTVRTANAGKALKRAMKSCTDPKLRTRYSVCIADGDAHTMDVQHHKSCWTKHVFHFQRDRSKEAQRTKQDPTQVASLIELINIIQNETKDGAYLSMQDIENTYVTLLGGSEALANHSPAYSRRWLKEIILSELPELKSARQKKHEGTSSLVLS